MKKEGYLEALPQWHGHGLADLVDLNVGHSPDGKATDQGVGIFSVLFKAKKNMKKKGMQKEMRKKEKKKKKGIELN